MLRIHVFRAIDHPKLCKRFATEHINIIRSYIGTTKITSFGNGWFFNPDVYVVMVEDVITKELIAGERIHLINTHYSLPVEDAFLQSIGKNYGPVASCPPDKIAGEMCALWSKKHVEGYGLSILLTKMAVALAHLLHIEKLFVLCAPHTVLMCQSAGFIIDTTINYPTPEWISTALILKDMGVLKNATKDFKKDIFSFIANSAGNVTIRGKKGNIEVRYNLTLPEGKRRQNHFFSYYTIRTARTTNNYWSMNTLSFTRKHPIAKTHNNDVFKDANALFLKHFNEGARSPPLYMKYFT